MLVKGKKKPVTLYEIVDYHDEDDRKSKRLMIENFQRALSFYENREFSKALDELKKLPQEKLTELYIEECRNLIATPPDDWEGVMVMLEK